MDVRGGAFNFAPFAAGVLAGANGTLVGHPFDTLKTRFQVGKVLKHSKFDMFFIRQLYRGILPPLLTSGAIQSVNFFIFENFRHWLRDSRSGPPKIQGDLASIFIAGTFSGSMVSLVTNPISVVKIRQQIVAEGGIMQCVREIKQSSGVAGFYRGYTTMLLLDASRGLYLTIYEVMKRVISYQCNNRPIFGDEDSTVGITLVSDQNHAYNSVSDIPTATSPTAASALKATATSAVPLATAPLLAPNSLTTRMLAAACTGIISWIIIFPIDVIRVRLHLDFSRTKYQSWRDCCVKTWREGGVRAYYRGIGYTLIRAGPVSAASLTTYEYTKELFERDF